MLFYGEIRKKTVAQTKGSPPREFTVVEQYLLFHFFAFCFSRRDQTLLHLFTFLLFSKASASRFALIWSRADYEMNFWDLNMSWQISLKSFLSWKTRKVQTMKCREKLSTLKIKFTEIPKCQKSIFLFNELKI